MTAYYCKSGSGVVPLANQAWATGSPGDRMVPTIADAGANVNVARRAVWECTTGGTSTGTPTWPAAITYDTTTVTQNGVVWTARRPGYTSGSTVNANWTMATPYVSYLALACNTSGDVGYVSNNHAETQGATYAVGPTIQGTSFFCVDDAAAPPTAEASTAAVTVNGATSNLTVGNQGTSIKGIILTCGTGQSTTCSIVAASGGCLFENMQYILTSSGTSSVINLGANLHTNCSVKFAAAGQGITASGCRVIGGSLLSGGTSPTALVNNNSGNISAYGNMNTSFNGFDLTNASAGINLSAVGSTGFGLQFYNICLPASWSGSIDSITPGIGAVVDLFNGDNTGTNYTVQRKMNSGALIQDTSIYRTGGASNGVTSLSWKIVTVAGAGPYPTKPFITPEIVKWFPITGFAVASPVTITLHFIRDNATDLNDDEIWMEAVYLGTSGAPLGTWASNARGLLATAAPQPDDSAATWSGTGGWSNPNKQKLTLTFTPNLAGIIHITVKVCKASATLYLDPQVDFS